jgi:hypothetical protein
MNKAMRRHMLDAVLQFGSRGAAVDLNGEVAGESTEPDSGKLLRFMHSASRGAINGSSQTGVSDFKPTWKSQFYLGPALSGAPFHHHGPAFNLIIHGRKEWTLLPPGQSLRHTEHRIYSGDHRNLCVSLCSHTGRDIYSSAHPLEWLAAGGPNAEYYPYRDDPAVGEASEATFGTSRPCKVVQRAGEVLFVPRHWTHQVSSHRTFATTLLVTQTTSCFVHSDTELGGVRRVCDRDRRLCWVIIQRPRQG